MPKKSDYKSNLIYILIVAFLLLGLYAYANNSALESEVREVGINEIYSNTEVKEVSVKDNKVTALLNDGTIMEAVKEPDDIVSEHFLDTDTSVTIVDTEGNKFWTDLAIGIIPFILIVGFLIFMMRQAQSSNNTAMSFGKSKARLYQNSKQRVTFKDVAGETESKEELVEVVDFLKNPNKYKAIGAKIPKGVMLVGPPGTGKTLLAKAVAGEANVPFFNISGSEFVEMFVGVGASRVRDLFNKAKRNAPCIVFIDEIDAVGRHRGAGLGGGHDEREQTLNQILVEMDGFDTHTNVIIIAATNRPDVLDPALLRPGRFDRRVVIDMPDLQEREDILRVHGRGKPLQKSVDLKRIARQTPGFAGADLENLMNEAAILAARNNKKSVSHKDLEMAIEKVVLGPEKKSKLIGEEEKKLTAYHEAGHAIVGHFLPDVDPVHKITIVGRGMAAGVTWFLPTKDQNIIPRSKMEQEIVKALGGFAAEEMIFGEMSTGPSNDLQKATDMVRNMVTRYGMSDELGPVAYHDTTHNVFLGKQISESKNYSDETAYKIDLEIKRIMKHSLIEAKNLLKKHKVHLENVAEELLKKESLSEKEFLAILADK